MAEMSQNPSWSERVKIQRVFDNNFTTSHEPLTSPHSKASKDSSGYSRPPHDVNSARALLARAARPSGTIMDTTPVRMFFKGLRRSVPELTFAEVRRDEEIEGGDSVIARGATPLAGHAEPAHAASSEIARGDIDDVDAERRVVPVSYTHLTLPTKRIV